MWTPLTAIVTNDHSEFSDKAIRLLLKWNPAKIQKLILLPALYRTAFDRTAFSNRPSQAETYRQLLPEKSQKVTDAFMKKGISTEYRIIDGDLGEVVDAQMDEVRGDLLSTGAQGHGCMHPLPIGNSSLIQVASSRHSVLILRP